MQGREAGKVQNDIPGRAGGSGLVCLGLPVLICLLLFPVRCSRNTTNILNVNADCVTLLLNNRLELTIAHATCPRWMITSAPNSIIAWLHEHLSF